jgi:opacity protein-like surface antigen
MKHMAIAVRIVAALLMLALFGAPASAQKVPSATVQEILIKASLLTFNDANVTGNYEVFHAKLSKPFRDQFSPVKLAETFKGFRDQHVDLDLIVAKAPISVAEPKIDDSGRLTLKGYFDTTPSRVNYDLGFTMSDGEWKLVGINVDLKKPESKIAETDSWGIEALG